MRVEIACGIQQPIAVGVRRTGSISLKCGVATESNSRGSSNIAQNNRGSGIKTAGAGDERHTNNLRVSFWFVDQKENLSFEMKASYRL
jgi:hypothetical protein